jgi:hypothetical protein
MAESSDDFVPFLQMKATWWLQLQSWVASASVLYIRHCQRFKHNRLVCDCNWL